MSCLPAVSLAVGVLCAPTSAWGGGFATARFGGEHGHPTTANPTAVFFNPASLTLGSGTRLYIEGLFAHRSLTHERPVGAISNVVTDGSTGTPQDAIDANAGTARLSNILASPFLGVVSDLGIRNLAVAAALYVPFGGQASWEQNEAFAGNQMYPGAVDGVQRWAVIEGTIRSLYSSAALAYHLPGPKLSFGLGVNLVQSSIDTIRARTPAGTDDLVGANGAILEGRSLVEASSTDLSIGVGLLWQPNPKTWLGVSYQSQPGFGTMRMSGTVVNKFGSGPETPSDIEILQSLPDIIRLGIRVRPVSRWEVRIGFDFTRWSVFETQCLVATNSGSDCDITESGAAAPGENGIVNNIMRRWKDTFSMRVGLSHWLQPSLEIGGSVTYDSNAVPDETIDASLPDAQKVVANLEARYALLEGKLTLSAGLSHVAFETREVEVLPRDGTGMQIGFDPPSRVPDPGGTYAQRITFVTVGALYNF